MWISCQEKNCRQLSLLTWNTFIGQLVHQVGGEGMQQSVDRYLN